MKTRQLDPKEIICARLRADHGFILLMNGSAYPKPIGHKPNVNEGMPIIINAWENRQAQIVAITHHSLN
jgi:hypothetical protein